MKGSTVSRRVSEFVGVALFAAALIWIIALASYEPTDPVWFFSTGAHAAPANFAGRVGAFLAELSFQLFGYAVVPDSRRCWSSIGWHYFWCRTVDAAGTKATGAGAALRLRQRVPEPRLRHARRLGQVVPRRRLRSATGSPRELSEYLNRTGSVIVILTLIVPGDHPVDAVLVRPVLRAR